MNKSSWTTPEDLRQQLLGVWERGHLLRALVEKRSDFPKRLTLKVPGPKEWSTRFPEVRLWIAALAAGARHYRIEWKEVQHRVLGANRVPAAVWVDTLDDALQWLVKQRAYTRFSRLLEQTESLHPQLLPWLAKRPLRALELAAVWPQLLQVVSWLRDHPRPGVYMRQIDIPLVHTKLIEEHRGVLAELLDLSLPEEAIDMAATGLGGFCRRFGLKEKPCRVRLRMLDPAQQWLPFTGDQELTVTAEVFAQMRPPVARVFLTENEVNFLSFPPISDAMVIFGAGYGFNALSPAAWLHSCALYYWGDIDTHGFAILDQLRAHFPSTRSLLMDRETLLQHRPLWVQEPQQCGATLQRLTAAEQELYQSLQQDAVGESVRLEQERVRLIHLTAALRALDLPLLSGL